MNRTSTGNEPMKEILAKISSYNIFNYLFPGAVFGFLADTIQILHLPKGDLATLLLLYYFIGMVVSRLGSVILEPMLKRAKFLKYADYGKYVTACEKDAQIITLVESSNTYRTLTSVFLALPLTAMGYYVAESLAFGALTRHMILIAFLLILFLFSFRKQSGYVLKRVSHHAP
jgi:hypothetical protein